MYADNNGLKIGDTITVGAQSGVENAAAAGRTYRITGFVALPDYNALFENNNDTMFDALQFGVCVVTEEGFPGHTDQRTWEYVWKYDEPPADKAEAADRAEVFLKELKDEVSLETFIPRDENQGVYYAGEDVSRDQVMVTVLLYIVIVIMAFVFAVTISNTITKEAAVIGTLRATGYTRGELVRHYMVLPLAVTLISGLAGNVLGYTVMKNFAAGLYYNSYSLPAYVTRWNADAFVKTTIVPVILMTVINFLMISAKLKLSPLRFLRRDLSRRRVQRVLPLSAHIPFFTRFRTRVILQNTGNYAVLFIGIFFANFLLLFGLLFPVTLRDYEEKVPDMMFCNYQYILTIPAGALDEEHKLKSLVSMLQFASDVETENPDAEKFSAYVLKSSGENNIIKEEITLYGIQEDSRYLPMDLQPGDVYISSAYADKYGLQPGDSFILNKEYSDESYEFTVTGIHDYEAAVCVFMPQADLNERFGLGKDTFSGYLSDTPVTDINEKYIGTMIDRSSMTKITRQLLHSMGGMMEIVNVFAVLMFVILVYLLSKIIIEKNAQSIAMTKILGYRGREISSLYIAPTTILVIVFILISFPLVNRLMEFLFRFMISQMMPGWIFYRVNPEIWVKMLVLGIGTYAAVAVLEYVKILRIPKDEALKNAE